VEAHSLRLSEHPDSDGAATFLERLDRLLYKNTASMTGGRNAERLDVQSILPLARRVLDWSWAVGLLLIVFCGSVLLASSRGMAISPTVTEWANAGALLGFACMVATPIGHLGHDIIAFAKQKKDAAREWRETLAKVASLNESELLILYWLLKDPPRQIELHDQAPAYALLGKGVLLFVANLGGNSLCELRPAIASRRHRFRAEIEQRLRDEPRPNNPPAPPR
jgi:hypothetical protein